MIRKRDDVNRYIKLGNNNSFWLNIALLVLILANAERNCRIVNQKQCQIQQLEHKLKEMEKELNNVKKEKDMYRDFDDAK